MRQRNALWCSPGVPDTPSMRFTFLLGRSEQLELPLGVHPAPLVAAFRRSGKRPGHPPDGRKDLLEGYTDLLSAGGWHRQFGRWHQLIGVAGLLRPPAGTHQALRPAKQAQLGQPDAGALRRPLAAANVIGQGLVGRVALAVLAKPLQQRQGDPLSFGRQGAGPGMGADQEFEAGALIAVQRPARAGSEPGVSVEFGQGFPPPASEAGRNPAQSYPSAKAALSLDGGPEFGEALG